MEATALSVGKSVLNGALSYAKSAIAEEVALQLGIQRDHAFVTDELEMMRSFMMTAHEERDDNKVVKTWVKQVRDTAYNVEDSLQDFAVRLKKPSRWHVLRTLLERRRIAKQMKELRAKVEDVSQRNVRYRLINDSGSKVTAAGVQPSLIAAAMFGVDDARRAAKQDNRRVDLIQLISKEDEDPNVIAVWGTSGDIGQTSIIREAYEHPDIRSKFPIRAWVRVMHPFSLKGFIQSLVNQFHTSEARGIEDLLETEQIEQDLAQKFNGYVNDERCLVVLNDLSTIEQWDLIKKCFRNIKKGSRILVSTAQVEMASLCAGQESQASELTQLSADQTLYAFYVKGSRNGKDSKKSASSSYAATSTNDQKVIPGEITEDQFKDDANENKVVKKSLTRIKTSAGALEESQIIGRDKEIAYINELVSNEDREQVQVIAVYGMGGLGKTTLVDSVYQNQKMGERFEKCVFVTILRPFDLEKLLRSLAVQLHEASSKKEELIDRVSTKKTVSTMGGEDLTKELGRLLGTKSCLIVLDDLSSRTEWDLIRPIIHQMEKKSRIIVTTRQEDTAEYCSGEHGKMYSLEVLEYEKSLCLLSEKVFGSRSALVEKHSELVEEAKQILKKCGGLPLAIATIGGFLANQPKTPVEWRKLNRNISSELEMNPELGKIRTILEKSYDGLPYHLKSCFLYLSIFPEDHIICRRRLVRRWAAEGYSTEFRGMSANEIADSYFTELKNRSMILPSQQSFLSRKSIDSCKVHDLIREIAISKSMEENLVFRLEEGCSLNTSGAIRHLAIGSNWTGDQSDFESIIDLSRMRSLSVFGEWRSFYISDKMRFLRVLDLEGTEDLYSHHLDRIGKLLHLRYLSIRGCDDVVLLPDSLGNLRQLQTLDIRDTNIIILPKAIIKLSKLQYVHAGGKSGSVEDESSSLTTRCFQFLSLCPRLCASCCAPSLLPMVGLKRREACTLACCVTLPFFLSGACDEGGVMVPRGIRKLKYLHTLRAVHVGRGNAVLQDIKRLTGLRKLGVNGINKKNGPTFCSAISSLSTLESLSVWSGGKPGLHGCLDGISSPPKNLQSLKLYGNLETLPKWIKELQHLVKLKLGDSRLSEHDSALELLGSLPKLDFLSLSRRAFQSEGLHLRSQQTADTAFKRLRVLELGGIGQTKSVKFEKGAMPKLELLSLRWIESEIDFSGLEFLPSINEVQLSIALPLDFSMIEKAHDKETQRRLVHDESYKIEQKEDAYRKKLRDQLAEIPRQPILSFLTLHGAQAH